MNVKELEDHIRYRYTTARTRLAVDADDSEIEQWLAVDSLDDDELVHVRGYLEANYVDDGGAWRDKRSHEKRLAREAAAAQQAKPPQSIVPRNTDADVAPIDALTTPEQKWVAVLEWAGGLKALLTPEYVASIPYDDLPMLNELLDPLGRIAHDGAIRRAKEQA